MENANIEAAVAKFVNFMTESAEQASDLAKQGAEVGMTFGSELVQQVLMFNAIESGAYALVAFVVSFLIAKWVRTNAKAVAGTGGSDRQRFLELARGKEEPATHAAQYVIKRNGTIEKVRGIDSDGDGRVYGGGYVYARNIEHRISISDYGDIVNQIREEKGAPTGSALIHSMHEGTDGFLSTIVLALAGALSAVIAWIGVAKAITVIKITVAPYLYLMEYAIELKDKV